jgi:hypothetical protein
MNRECSCTASDLVSSPGLSILVYNTPAVRQSQLTFNAIQQLVGSIRVQFGQGLELCCVYVVFCVCVCPGCGKISCLEKETRQARIRNDCPYIFNRAQGGAPGRVA